MSGGYLDDLGSELSAAGIHGARRARILAEFSDHLESDPKAQLGAPRELARQFADELGTSRVRRSAFAAFGALVLAGAVFGLSFLTASGSSEYGVYNHPHSSAIATIATLIAALAPQLAFVAGTLALLRAGWRRNDAVVPRAEAVVMLRRTAVGLASGVVAMAALAVLALQHPQGLPSSWRTLTLIATGVGVVALLAALPALLAATRLVPTGAGDAGNIFDDFGPFTPSVLNGQPWLFAVVVAAGVGLAVALAGVAGADPYDGIARGVAEMLACLAGFALLGPYLGLWSRKARPAAA